MGDTESIFRKVVYNDFCIFPFSHDTVIYSTGNLKLKFTGFDTIEQRECAVLESNIDVSNLHTSLDKYFDFDMWFSQTGFGKYYFSLEERCFIAVDLELKYNLMLYDKCYRENQNKFYESMEKNNMVALVEWMPILDVNCEVIKSIKIRLKEIVEKYPF
jgi:hypothetical protein